MRKGKEQRPARACQAAEQVLADRVHFVLPPAQWEKFCAALHPPPRELPALRKLLTEPSVFEAPGPPRKAKS
jgi:uncharacterized protein (DUF1778 family)